MKADANLRRLLAAAVKAAKAAGAVMRRDLNSAKRVNASSQHDIKLELDVRCQQIIERTLRAGFPRVAVLGEEGVTGDLESAHRWVVDPIDGTVNFAHGIPHACVSIAFQSRLEDGTHETRVGVVFDPFAGELWTAIRGGPALLNGRPIRISTRARLNEAIVSVGFAKHRSTLDQMLPVLNAMVHRVRKIRVMGSAALAMTYVASGRFDAYVEPGIRTWDIAAGGLILECAGGDYWQHPLPGRHRHRVMANNGSLRPALGRVLRRHWKEIG